MEIRESLQVIPPTITDDQNRRLSEPYAEWEIKRALFQLYPFKAPGLDGYPAGFFQKFWGIIRRDFISSCFAILHEGQIPVGTNDTLIVLIPKTKSAGKMEDYRPISLTTVVSKTVAKAIVNWLQQILPEGKSVYGSLKLDMSKAYDRVEWRFLQLLMLRLGFEARWVNMILSYVSSVRYAIRLNGKVSNFFVPGRDDCLLLFKAKDGTAEALSSQLSKYEGISGQVINYNKSELVLSQNSSEELRNHFGSQLSVLIVSHHAKYLGLPLSLQRKLSLNFSSMIDKFWNKTEGWVSKKLSAGGKEILIKAVLQALPQYAMNCFLLLVQTLCKEKNQGGLGFKDLQCINMAFLAKQAWRIYTKPELLVSKIFKAKYCPDYDMLNCSVGAYSLIRHIKTVNIGEDIGCTDMSPSQKFWAEFWKLEVPRKIKIFGWRSYHGALPTGISLQKRGMDINIGCGECGYHIESYSHAFLHCWFARAVWFRMGIPELCELPSSVVFTDIIDYCWSYFSQKRRQTVLVTLWMIWFKRNKRKHEDSEFSVNDLVFKAFNLSRSFEQYNSKYLSSLRFLFSSEFGWKKPPVGFLKVNNDAAWKDSEGGGIGIIVRDNEGITIAVRSIKAVNIHNSVSCEGLGLLESFKLAEKLGADKVIFESDCADVVKWLNICPDDNILMKSGLQKAYKSFTGIWNGKCSLFKERQTSLQTSWQNVRWNLTGAGQY
ncbi:hypothetical protein QQ045_001617 [Rhodiola kirilowii]